MDEFQLAETWIKATLLAATGVTDYVADRVFDAPPPEGTQYPYIIFNMASTDDVRGVGTARIMSDTIYTVKAVIGTGQHEDMGAIAAAIDVALTLEQPEAVGTDGSIEACVRQRGVRYTEYTAGNEYAHRGGDYQILVSLN